MSESAHVRLSALGKLVAMVVLAGVLVAALLLPFVGGTGLVARNSSSLLDALPVELTDQTPNGNTKVLAADGTLITEFYENNRTPVTPEQVSPVMKQAIVDIEDSRFYEHNGLDVQGTLRALAKNLAAGGVQEGGSTLTQQLVKQTLLQTAETPEDAQAATEQTVGRKLKEARLALALEQTYSKDEILTRYLNIAYFGHSAYGIQAAAQTYFSVNAIDLTLPQAAVLAGLVQSPTEDDPLANPEAAQTRRNQVLNRMHDLGHITDQELADVSASPIQTAEGAKPPNGCAQATIGGFFCDYVEGYLKGTLQLSDSQLENGGYTIQTTLRTDMQKAGDEAVLNTVGLDNELIGVYDVIEPGTGHVLAMSVNRTFGCAEGVGCESVNFGITPSKGSGSTFKTFVAAAALEAGLPANHVITTSNPYTSKVFKRNGGTRGAPYSVPNASNGYPNTLTMEQALYMSSNTYFLALLDELGSVEPAVRMAERLGMTFGAPNQKSAEYWIDGKLGSFPYSPEPVSPLDLTNAYSTIAASGVKCAPTPVVGITTSAGQPLTGADGQPVVKGDSCSQVLDAGLANTMNQMMRKDVEPGFPLQTAERAYVEGHQIAGKTGTVNNNDSVTFVGYTPEYTGTVMVFRPLGTETVGGFGGNKPATIWHDAMFPVLSAQATAEFPPADPKYVGAAPAPAPSSGSSGSGNGNGGNRGDGGNNRGNNDDDAGTTAEDAPAEATSEAPAPAVESQQPTDQGGPPPDTNGDGQPG
jgi:membrane peptidoglycan carboxypeptidase